MYRIPWTRCGLGRNRGFQILNPTLNPKTLDQVRSEMAEEEQGEEAAANKKAAHHKESEALAARSALGR
jgi:hypothetical protein